MKYRQKVGELMKFIMAQPAIKRFEWEDDVAVTNLLTLGVNPDDIIILMRENDPLMPQRLRDRFKIRVYTFKDTMDSKAKAYIPSVRPWLWWQFLKNYPEMENEDYMYQDSDIIYRKIPNFNTTPATPNHWYCSDTESYTGPDYIRSKGTTLVRDVGAILGLTEQQMWSFKGRGGGAQWVISHPTADYWHDVFEKSCILYDWFTRIEPSYKALYARQGRPHEYPIQKWCAEMYAELYLCAKYGVTTEISEELNFAWSSDEANSYSKDRNILHNSGITAKVAKEKHLFLKGDYVKVSPFSANLSWVNPKYSSYEYVQAIFKTKQKGGVTVHD